MLDGSTPEALEAQAEQERLELQNALVNAFPNFVALARIIHLIFDESLDAIGGGADQPLGDVVFKTTLWAKRQGVLNELVAGSIRYNPSNPVLVDFHKKYGMKYKSARDMRSASILPMMSAGVPASSLAKASCCSDTRNDVLISALQQIDKERNAEEALIIEYIRALSLLSFSVSVRDLLGNRNYDQIFYDLPDNWGATLAQHQDTLEKIDFYVSAQNLKVAPQTINRLRNDVLEAKSRLDTANVHLLSWKTPSDVEIEGAMNPISEALMLLESISQTTLGVIRTDWNKSAADQKRNWIVARLNCGQMATYFRGI